MIKHVLRTSFLAVAMTVTASAAASAQGFEQQLVLAGSSASEIVFGQGSLNLTVGAFTAGETSKQALASSTYSYVTTDSAQAIMVSLAANDTLPAGATLTVALDGGAAVTLDGETLRAARTGINAGSGSGTIEYVYTTLPSTPIASKTITVVYTFGANP